ncbi:MAG: protein kinase [Kangiellaceae bacterium]|nr:protein kinase [Kangiellaceae bacterium]
MTSEPLKSVRQAIEAESTVEKTKIEQPVRLGRYRILDEVGRGATALVYRAYDPQLDRFIAIKVLRERLAKDDDYREGFVREARLAAQLTHSNIVTIYDVGISDNKPYIAMELMEGATLEDILKRNAKLSLNTVLSIVRQLAGALSYAHKHGVVHRDIKPGNILILKDKKTAKLTDFGIAQIDETLAKTGRVTDKVLGTPEYMSPEQILGQSLDRRSDLYSTGVLMYKMISGLPPFMADDLGDLFKQIIRSKQPEIVIDNNLVKDDVNDLLRKLLQKRPEKRFQNAEQLLSEIRYIINKIIKPKEKQKAHFTSLTTRWTITMASSVFVSMCIGLVVVYAMQFRALSGIAYDYGHTVGKMIAYQSSEVVVLEDWVGLRALVKEVAKNEQLASIYILNRGGEVLASNLTFKKGQLFENPNSDEPVKKIDSTLIYRRTLADDSVLFDVSMPIYVGERMVGQLFVSYSASTIYDASNTTLITMLVVMLVTLLVVSAATLILAKQTSQDYKRVTLGLKKMSVGRVDSRILTERNDEASGLFIAFNQLAAYLERLSDSRQAGTVGDTRQFESIKFHSKHDDSLQQVDTVEINIEDKD